MKDKFLQIIAGLAGIVVESIREGGKFLVVFATKLLKSELWVAIGAMLLGGLALKLGIPEEKLIEFWTMLGGVAATYIAGRSYAKPRELGAVKQDP